LREKLSDLLGEKIRQIIDIMDKPDYTPKLQNQNQLDTIYESDFKDIQPYLFRVSDLKWPLLDMSQIEGTRRNPQHFVTGSWVQIIKKGFKFKFSLNLKDLSFIRRRSKSSICWNYHETHAQGCTHFQLARKNIIFMINL
jgi:hypothetical protein